jgi:hypothetical protein
VIARRAFVRGALGASALGAIPVPLRGLVRWSAGIEAGVPRRAVLGQGGYGALIPSRDCPELALPRGFRCMRLSVSGDPMSDGTPTPDLFDGMAAFPLPNGSVRLIRNHEVTGRGLMGVAELAWDPVAGGGTTSLEVRVRGDGSVEKVREFVSLGGTLINCAGGPTPWGSWLSCEETVRGQDRGWRRAHGYVFEVPVAAEAQVAARPLPALGRFVHEAVAVDPATGIVYLTEDLRVAPAFGRLGSGFYRFTPSVNGRLAAGGRLEALAVAGRPRYATYRRQRAGQALPVTWVPIDDPDPRAAETDESAVLRQGLEQGAAIFERLEGCWHWDGAIVFAATTGGDANRGQIWQYRPGGPEHGVLTLVFESPGADVLNGPDNLTVSRRGRGLLLCEDNGERVHLRGLTPEGAIFDFARNLADSREFAGACFSPDGAVLFVNLQGAGPGRSVTYAITGPWETGVL